MGNVATSIYNRTSTSNKRNVIPAITFLFSHHRIIMWNFLRNVGETNYKIINDNIDEVINENDAGVRYIDHPRHHLPIDDDNTNNDQRFTGQFSSGATFNNDELLINLDQFAKHVDAEHDRQMLKRIRLRSIRRQTSDARGKKIVFCPFTILIEFYRERWRQQISFEFIFFFFFDLK